MRSIPPRAALCEAAPAPDTLAEGGRPDARYDVVTLGECMVRYTPQSGQMLEQADSLRADPAGTESNTAVALARLGVRVSWLSALPRTPMGRWIATRLEAHGVDTSPVRWTEDRLGVFFFEAGAPPRGSRVVYDRAHSAVSRLTPGMVDWRLFDHTRLVHTTGITAALSDASHALVVRALEEAKARGARTTFDINYRAKLWPPDRAAARLTPILERVDVLISTASDAALLFHLAGPPEGVIEALCERFPAAVIVLTLAEGGAVGWSASTGWLKTGAHPVEQVDRLGAGDAFDAGLLYGLLKDDLALGMACGAALAALSYAEQGDIGWSTVEEMLQLAGFRPNEPFAEGPSTP